jgi:hypothetical protein
MIKKIQYSIDFVELCGLEPVRKIMWLIFRFAASRSFDTVHPTDKNTINKVIFQRLQIIFIHYLSDSLAD